MWAHICTSEGTLCVFLSFVPQETILYPNCTLLFWEWTIIEIVLGLDRCRLANLLQIMKHLLRLMANLTVPFVIPCQCIKTVCYTLQDVMSTQAASCCQGALFWLHAAPINGSKVEIIYCRKDGAPGSATPVLIGPIAVTLLPQPTHLTPIFNLFRIQLVLSAVFW